MSKGIWHFARRSAMDILTVCLMVLAVSLALQPGSSLRNRWERFRLARISSSAADRHWSKLEAVASPLTSGLSTDVIEILDYECPFCRAAAAPVDSAIDAGLRVSVLSYPIPTHPQARSAALAVLCAEKAGRLPEMHWTLLTSPAWRQDSNWAREGSSAGIADSSAFVACISSAETERRLADQIRWADTLGATGTPMFVSRRGVHRGVPTKAILLKLGGMH